MAEGDIHFMHAQTKQAICGETKPEGSVQAGVVIEKIDCVECLRALVIDAARYGNGRTPRRGPYS